MQGGSRFTTHARGEAMCVELTMCPEQGGVNELKEVGGGILLSTIVLLLHKPVMPRSLGVRSLQDALNKWVPEALVLGKCTQKLKCGSSPARVAAVRQSAIS